MTKSEITRLLNNHTYVEDEINSCIEAMRRLAEVTACERDIKSTIISGMPGNTSMISDPTYQKAERILTEYKREIDRLERKQAGIFERRALVEELLDVLVPAELKIIKLRYIKKYAWWMVCEHMHYARRQCFNIRDAALEKMLLAANKKGL